MRPARRLSPAVLLPLLLAAAAPSRAVRPLTPQAPEFPAGKVWLNAKPLSMKLLRGRKVVVVAFINTGNINSLRVLPTLNEWFARYALDGLMLVGVQTPDYEFQKDPVATGKALKRLGVRFPVLLDTDRVLWKAYAAEGWPVVYLVDHKGRIIFDRLGEGRYGEFETEIRSALERLTGEPAPKAAALAEDIPDSDCGTMSETLHAGTARGKPVAVEDLHRRRNEIYIKTREGEVSFQGDWGLEPESLIMKKKNKGREFQVSFVYHGARAFLLAGAGAKPQRIYVLQDEGWLRPEFAGRDIRYDDENASYVQADETRVFDLVRNPTDDPHELVVAPADAGARVYELSFGDRCTESRP